MKFLANLRVIMALFLAAILTSVLVSACSIFGGKETPPPAPQTAAIHAPPENIRVLVGSPVQIHSTHPGGDQLSRVELLISGGTIGPETLQRSDTPTNGFVVQEWRPPAPGVYLIRVRGIGADGSEISNLTRQIEAIDTQVLSGIAIAQADEFLQAEPTKVIAPLAATPTPGAASTSNDAGAAFVISSTGGEALAATPVPSYPPPPPMPGVPPGPTQAQLSPYTAPVCDAAKFVEVFAPATTNQRQFVKEPDNKAALAVGGTVIHRAWRLQNIGTCTWGPGYELAFYGGRAMGSGGVVFDSAYPTEPARRNALIDNNRLIVPDGKPNQMAVLELLLNVPTTPGIHQSYWRMRNPHGVYFGPILGVTLEVIRDCAFSSEGERTIYGAPFIRKFEILGVGDVYQPTDPVNVVARKGEDLTLEWNIVNATNFDIVFKDPTGNIESVSTSDPNSRATFPTGTEGDHIITLFADNGICTSKAEVNVKVVPREGDGFSASVAFATNAPVSSSNANVAFSSNVKPGTVEVQWQHFDDNVTEVILHIDRFRQRTKTNCTLSEWLGNLLCSESDVWQKIGSETVSVGRSAAGAAAICQDSPTCRNLAGAPSTLPIEISSNEHSALIFCPAAGGQEGTGIQFYLEARTNSGPAQPQFSNTVDVQCNSFATEIQSEFNPNN